MVTVIELQTDTGTIYAIGAYPTMAAASAGLPEGAYTTFRTYSGDRVVRLAGHFHRLEESLGLMGHAVRLDQSSARQAISAARVSAGHAESRFRLTLVPGPPARLFIAVEAFTPLPPSDYARGVRCVTVQAERSNPHAKSTNFITTADRTKRLLPAGINEGLMVAADGTILEGLSSNFFALIGRTLHTEEDRALAGLTRALVLEVAASTGLAVDRRGIRHAELPDVEECLITSVSREILPVVEIDGQKIGSGAPGPQSLILMAAFAELARREARLIHVV
ncbi:MAG: aminotransferase class IV [Thermoflexales bacterium]